jgi:hypothetical protein
MVATTGDRSCKNKTLQSPRKKKLQKIADRAIQKEAFNELLVRKRLNGGKLPFGSIGNIASEFKSIGYNSVTRRNLHYRLSKFETTGMVTMVSELAPPSKTIHSTNQSELSSLTENVLHDDVVVTSTSTTDDESTSVNNEDNNDTITVVLDDTDDMAKKRKEGLEKKRKKRIQKTVVKEAILTIATKYNELRESAIATSNNVAAGTLANLIQSTTNKLGLPDGIIKKETILSRLRRGNISGIAHHKISPLNEVEPLLVELCIQMAKIGEALTKENVMDLATELINGTEHAV